MKTTDWLDREKTEKNIWFNTEPNVSRNGRLNGIVMQIIIYRTWIEEPEFL